MNILIEKTLNKIIYNIKFNDKSNIINILIKN